MVRMLAEWEPQSAIMLAWPHADTDWAANLEAAEKSYIAMLAAITRTQIAVILVPDDTVSSHVESLAREHGVDVSRSRRVHVDYNDTWTRDYGPLAVETTNGIELVKFVFNGWGNRFDARLDNEATLQLAQKGLFGTTHCRSVDWILEGGAVESDGAGTILTTRKCLLNENRNAGTSEPDVIAVLKTRLGARRVLWLDHADIAGDDTDGHVDMLARFVSPDTIAHCTCDDPCDEHFPVMRELEKQLASLKRADGTPYRLVPLPLPRPVLDDEGHRLPATYANFLIINDAILLPVYDDPADTVAVDRLRGCFPHRRVVPIPARALITQGGAVHCATMQLPSGIL